MCFSHLWSAVPFYNLSQLCFIIPPRKLLLNSLISITPIQVARCNRSISNRLCQRGYAYLLGSDDIEHTLEIIGRPLLPEGLQAKIKKEKNTRFKLKRYHSLPNTCAKGIFLPACETMEHSALAAPPFTDSMLILLLGVVGVNGEWAGC